jgi:hypothetical protein
LAKLYLHCCKKALALMLKGQRQAQDCSDPILQSSAGLGEQFPPGIRVPCDKTRPEALRFRKQEAALFAQPEDILPANLPGRPLGIGIALSALGKSMR